MNDEMSCENSSFKILTIKLERRNLYIIDFVPST